MNFHRSSLLRLLLPTIRVFSQMETAPSVSISTINIYIYIHTRRFAQKAANKYRRVNARSRVCVHVSPLSFSLSLSSLSWQSMAEVAAAVRVCLSRPAVSKANDLPWNLDNLSARLQSRERERETCTCSKSRYVPSLFRFLSLFCNLCPTYIHPSVSFQTAPLPTAPRVSRPFTYRSPMQRGMNGTRRVEGVSPTTSLVSLFL